MTWVKRVEETAQACICSTLLLVAAGPEAGAEGKEDGAVEYVAGLDGGVAGKQYWKLARGVIDARDEEGLLSQLVGALFNRSDFANELGIRTQVAGAEVLVELLRRRAKQHVRGS